MNAPIRVHIHPLASCYSVLIEHAQSDVQNDAQNHSAETQPTTTSLMATDREILPFTMTLEPSDESLIAFLGRIVRVLSDLFEKHHDTAKQTDGTPLFDVTTMQPCLLTIYGTSIMSCTQIRDNDILYLSLDGPKRLPRMHELMLIMASMGARLDISGSMASNAPLQHPHYLMNQHATQQHQQHMMIPHPQLHQWYDEDDSDDDTDASDTDDSLSGTNFNSRSPHNVHLSHRHRRHSRSPVLSSHTQRRSKHHRTALSQQNTLGGIMARSTHASAHSVSDTPHHASIGAHGPLSMHHHPIRILPTDLFVSILSFMTHDELLEASLVCHSWYKLIMDEDVVWRELCANVYYERERERRRRRALENGLSIIGVDGLAAQQSIGTPQSPNSTPHTTTVGPNSTIQTVPTSDSTATLAGRPTPPAGGPAGASSRVALEIPLEQIRSIFLNRKRPPVYKRWKTYYRYYILFAGSISWDTTQCGPSIKFKNNSRTIYREDNVSYHWQTVRSSRAIQIPTEEEQKKNGIHNPNNIDDMAIYEWEIEVNRFDKTNQNGWWIVVSVATEEFPWRSTSPSSLVGYENANGFGYATNGDCLHCYSNPSLKFKQKFTCQPIQPFVPKSFGEGDVVKVRLQFCNKLHRDLLDPKMWVGATLEIFVNGEYVGQAFRNIEGKVYPAVSILTNQCVTLRAVDPIADEWRKAVMNGSGGM